MALVERLAILIDASSQGATREFRKLGTEAERTDKKVDKLSRTSTLVKGAIGAIGVTTAVAGLARFADASIEAASNLEEVRNKSREVFEGEFGKIEQFAEGAADSLGLSTRAAFEFASSFGNLFSSAGFASDDAAALSENLTTLAADLASFNNISVDEAFQKLRSGLSGEAEPLRQVGVFLSAAKVEAEAYSSGIAETGTVLTEAQKIQARYNIILKETTKAQGDVGRTSESLANQQRKLNAQLEDTQAQLGQDLLPVKAEAVGALAEITGAFGDLDELVREASGGVKGIYGTLQDLATGGIGGLVGTNIGEFFGRTRDSVVEASDALEDDFEPATRQVIDRLEEAKRPASDLGGEFAYIDDTANAASDAIERLRDAVDELRQPTLDLRSAQRDLADSVDDFIGTLKDAESTERDQEAALDGIADSSFDLLAAYADTGASAADLRRKTEELRGKLVDAATQFLGSRDAAERYADEIGLIPASVTTNVVLAGIDSAIAKARELASVTSGLSVSQLTSVVRQDEAMANRGARASGGPVTAGTYLVGERGPELLTLSGGTSGRVFSDRQTRSMAAGVTVNVGTVVAHDYGDFMRQMQQRTRLANLAA